MMKKRLENSEKTRNFLNSLDRVYIVGCWARYGVREHFFAGKFVNEQFSGKPVPLVYDYDDHNGTDDAFYLRPITSTTTGSIIMYTFNKFYAEKVADALNEKMVRERENTKK